MAGQGVAPTIGMTPEQVAAAQIKLGEAETALGNAETVRTDSLNKTAIKDDKIASLRAVMGGLVTQIEGFAKATQDEGVYTTASIAKPKQRTPRTEAPVPANLTLRNTTNGNLVLSYEANKGQGSVFVIQRRYKTLAGVVSSFQYLDTTGEKTWTDTNVPGGLEWIAYQVATKLTNNVVSDWSDEKAFNFGTVGGEAPVQAAQTTGESASGGSGGPDGGESLTIEDAQALRDAQTAKGKPQAG
ncbi:MAG: hypothetical protein ACIAQU_05730 [Phycisphaerales bacterium JB064]